MTNLTRLAAIAGNILANSDATHNDCGVLKDGEGNAWVIMREDLAALSAHLDATHPPPSPQMAVTWLPIERADRSISDVQKFEEVGIVLRNSDPYWVRDDDGRVYEAVWTESDNLSFSHGGHWWDLEGESPVDPVEFMPHPLDPRFQPDAKLEDQP